MSMKKTKKIVLWVGLIAFFCGVGILFANDYGGFSCHYYTANGHTVKYCETGFFTLLPLATTFLLSLITYKMRDEVFLAWLRFAYWWIPLSMFFTLITPGSSGGGFGIPSVFDKEFLAFILSALFFIISLVIIVRKALTLRNKQ